MTEDALTNQIATVATKVVQEVQDSGGSSTLVTSLLTLIVVKVWSKMYQHLTEIAGTFKTFVKLVQDVASGKTPMTVRLVSSPVPNAVDDVALDEPTQS